MPFAASHSRSHAGRWRRCAARLCLGAVAALAAACGPSVKNSWKTAHMTPPSPRVAEALAKKQTICFDRFLIDVPEGTQVVWGGHSAPQDVSIAPGRAQELQRVVAEREAELKAKRRYPRTKNLSLYFETLDGVLPGMKHVVSQRDFGSEGMFRIDTYFAMGDSLVSMDAGFLAKSTEGADRQSALNILNDMARRLRPRDNYEIPTEPGLCLDNAFLADPTEPGPEERANLLNVGLRLKVFPDVHLSISLMPTNPDEEAQWSLDNQLRISEENAARDGLPNPFREMTFLRRAKREIGDWKDGFEVITIVPDQPKKKVNSYQDFLMRFRGQPDKWLFPHIDIAMQTGAGDKRVGQVKSSLSYDEGIALWDAITSSIRPRPVGPVKTSEAAPPKAPLGELAATGRECPQSGWWQCADAGNVQGGRRQFFRAGERMPHAVLQGEPSVWQKLKGEVPQHKAATVWQLVDYGEPPVPSAAPMTGTAPAPAEAPPSDKA